MPQETRYYVPKLQAVKNIVADPERYGIDLVEVPNQPYFTAVTTDRHMDVKVAAKLAGVSLSEFVSLNPGYSRPVIRADGTQTLLVPADRANAFIANLENHDEPLASWHTYTLKSGDRLDRVAARHGISLAQLRQVNSIAPNRKLRPGSTLLVPAAGTAEVNLPDLPAPPVASPKAAEKTARYASAARKTGRKTGAKRVAYVVPARKAYATPTGKVVHAAPGKRVAHGAPPKKIVAKKQTVAARRAKPPATRRIVLAQKSR